MSLSLDEPMLTAKQVVRRLQISLRTLWRWVKRKHLPKPYYATPHAPRWSKADVERVMERTRQE